MTIKTDARGVKTDYVYDALNRVTNRNYSLTGSTPPNYQASPNVIYTYDNLPHAKGKLTKVTTGTGAPPLSVTEYQEFDLLGRVKQSQQWVEGTAYGVPMTYTYNLSGALIEQKYPSGRIVRNTLDSTGDLQQVQSQKSGGTLQNYANAFTYTAAGAVSALRLGNGKWETAQFNSRLQPTQIGLGSGSAVQNLLKLNCSYNTSGNADNNGNVLSQTITVNRSNQSPLVFSQSYVYDSLNRLKSAEEKDAANVTSWKQTYTFDRYGNRRFDQTNTTQPASFANPNVTNPTIDPSNNRFTTGQGWVYDLAGNVITDAEGRSFNYDSENKQIEAKNSSSSTLGTYYFDGDGKRVKKVVPNGETTIFVYDAGGKMVAEYSTVVAPVETAKVQYLTNDNLGTPRINTDATGNIVSRSDYMPYGEEIVALGGRSANDKYVADDVRQGFTGYINDSETGLDFAQARMYAHQLGRFSTVDPVISSARAEVPQTWNRYVYALNSPTLFLDPDGKDIILLIWATEDGKIGHAGIAIANYKIEKKVVNGKTVETKVPDGTYTYRDLWPGGEGANATNYDKNIPAAYGKEFAGSLKQLLNSDITGSEGYAPDGAIQLSTDWATDNKVHLALDKLQQENPNYNGISMNCTDFVERGVETATGNNINADETVDSKMVSTGSITQDRFGGKLESISSTTPNQLFKAARGLSNATVIKDPGSKVDNPFTRSVVTGTIKRKFQ